MVDESPAGQLAEIPVSSSSRTSYGDRFALRVEATKVAAVTATGSSYGFHLYARAAELYDLSMATMNISAARTHLLDAMETARTEAVFLQRRGRLAGVLVSPERYEQLMTAMEDAEDLTGFDAAMAEEGPNIPWDQVKADLGWE